jgi:dsDNA-binding SOS-regulon protein
MTIEVSDRAMRSAAQLAAQSQQRVEDVLADWVDRLAVELPVEWLADDQVLALADLKLEAEQQEELSDLLAANREGVLDTQGQARLDELMHIYRQGMVRKAQALREAVRRGLHPPLS